LNLKDRKEDFYSAIRTLQRDTGFWAKLSANARETIKKNFPEETCAALWAELLRSFGERRHTCRVKSPFFIRLPRRNPKFGHYDNRPPFAVRLRFCIGGLRRWLSLT